MEDSKSSYLKGVATQATAILLAALGAGAIAFFQSLASQAGACPTPTMAPEEAGALGALFKAAHTALTMGHGTMRV